MTSYANEDLTGATFERVNLSDARFTRVKFHRAELRNVDFSGSIVRGAAFNHTRLIGVELFDTEITADLHNTVINGVDIAPLVEAELNRRDPDRALIRPDDAAGFRAAWDMLERRWEETLAHARTLSPADLHRNVDDEWSFIQTLRHLNYASAVWVGRMILGNPTPWHPLDLPWDEAPESIGMTPDRAARPSLDEVLEIRRQRQAMVRSVIESLTAEQLAGKVSCTAPGWPQLEDFELAECLRIVLNEEWEHRQFAERDLAKLHGEV